MPGQQTPGINAYCSWRSHGAPGGGLLQLDDRPIVHGRLQKALHVVEREVR